jgi:RHS repeat-associated protein
VRTDRHESNVIHTDEFRVDGLGNIIAARNSTNNAPPGPFHDYEYVGGQLRNIERGNGVMLLDGVTSEEVENGYDNAGNVVSSSSDRSVYDAPIGFWQPVHRTLSRSFFSADHRLTVHQRYSGAEVSGGNSEGVYEEYRYDELGRRVLVRSRRDGLCSGHTACHGAITRYVWDGDAILFELRADGANNVGGLELTSGSAPYYGRVGYVHGPELDKPLAVIRGGDANGFIVPHLNWRGLYDRATNANGAHVTAPIEWPGKTHRSYHKEELDSKPHSTWYGSLIIDQKDATGLMYRRNRYYDDPATGRFTQEDPIGLAGGLNLYGFGGGDPINFTDPFGLCPPENLNLLDCPPGYFTALGVTLGGGAGGAGGAIIGGLGGGTACTVTGPGNLLCAGGGAAAGGVAGAGLGAKVGAFVGSALDVGLMLARKADIRQVDQAIREALGRKPTDDERGAFRDQIHDEKKVGGGDFSYRDLVRLAKELFGGSQ